jgi:hypothetical protein
MSPPADGRSLHSKLETERGRALTHFEREFARLRRHEAFKHPLFPSVQSLADGHRLNAGQFDAFRSAMLARIFPTIPSIAEHAKQAALAGDYEMLATVLRNLREEAADGDVARMHPKLAENAFNAVGQQVFGLPRTTMKEAYDSRLESSVAMRHYASVVHEIYSTRPVFASLVQEAASGGDGRTGMMADLYALFSTFVPSLTLAQFNERVLPYFSEHLALQGDGAYRDDATSGVECEHGRRALEDATKRIRTLVDVRNALTTMHSFADAQGQLFDAILDEVRRLE